MKNSVLRKALITLVVWSIIGIIFMNSIIGRTSKQEKVFEWMKAQTPTPLDLVIVTGSSANHHDALFSIGFPP